MVSTSASDCLERLVSEMTYYYYELYSFTQKLKLKKN